MKKLIIILLLGLAALGASSEISRKTALIQSYQDSLALAETPQDSIRMMYNIFDLDLKRRPEISLKLLNLVGQYGNREDVLDVIRVTATLHSSDTLLLDSLTQVVKQFSDHPDVNETHLLLKLLRIENRYDNIQVNRMSRSKIAQMIVDAKQHRYNNEEERLTKLFEIVMAVSKLSRGPLLASYIDSLQHQAERMNLPTGGLRYYIYDKTGSIFSSPLVIPQAVRTDKKLLNLIDSLTREYTHQDRPHRSFPLFRYNIYRRLLKNASALNDAEIEQYYGEATALAEDDSVIATDIATNRMLDIYYHMARKDYAKAMPLIEKQLFNSNKVAIADPSLYELLYEAAKGVGNRDVMRSATEVLYPLKAQELREREQFRFNDMRILYQSDSIQASDAVKSTYAKERQASEKKSHYIILGICLVALLFLAVFILFLARQRSKILEMAESLRATNGKLLSERNELRQAQDDLIEARDASKAADRLKTDFINNMSHEIKAPLNAISEYSRLIVDCIPDERRNYLDKFANIISINTRLVLTLVNDVLDVASLERNEMSVTKEPVNVADICAVALGNVFENGTTAPDSPVQLIFQPMDNEVSILTDPQRVGQVLTNLLSNAKKFTEKGTITLSYATNPESKTITFSVSDTGIGVPKGQEEEIFSRFRQLDHTVQGTGLGLYISRLLAELLGGSITVDTSYRGGARFDFTIPTGF